MDQSVPVSKFKDIVSDCINRVQYKGDRILLERHRKDCVALVSMGDYQLLKEMSYVRGEKIKKIYEEDYNQLEELLEYVGAQSLSELLSACKMHHIRDAIKDDIASTKALDKKSLL